MPEYRVDELARAAGATVRSIRVYQDRGLLPAPVLRGRVGFYDDSHLARLRMIGQLQERGHTLATIGELLATWEAGRDLGDLLGIEDAVTRPWETDTSAVQPVELSVDDLIDQYGPKPASRERAVELRILTPAADENYTITSQAAIDTGAALIRAGLSMEDVLALTAEVIERTDALAQHVVRRVGSLLLTAEGELPDSARIHEIRGLLEELQPVSIASVAGWFTRSLSEAASAYLAEVLDGSR